MADNLNRCCANPRKSIELNCSLNVVNGTYVVQSELFHGRPFYKQKIEDDVEIAEDDEKREPLYLW